MTRATIRYGFEAKAINWAMELSERLKGDPYYGFFLVLGRDGTVKRMEVAHEPERFDGEMCKRLKKENDSWIFYNPFCGPEYSALGWQNVSRGAFEEITKISFEDRDFVSKGKEIDFPEEWDFVI